MTGGTDPVRGGTGLPQLVCASANPDKVAEIAAILDVAEATARVHLHRGRQTLAAALENEETS